jgi:hypothetical protein
VKLENFNQLLLESVGVGLAILKTDTGEFVFGNWSGFPAPSVSTASSATSFPISAASVSRRTSTRTGRSPPKSPSSRSAAR